VLDIYYYFYKGCVVKAVEVDLDVEFYFFVKSVRLIEQAHSKTGRRARETKEQLNNITGSKKNRKTASLTVKSASISAYPVQSLLKALKIACDHP